MGRIKTLLVKRITHDLMDAHGCDMKSDFGANKELVNQLVEVPSKKIRNTIAGYATRLVKKQEQKPRARKMQPMQKQGYGSAGDDSF